MLIDGKETEVKKEDWDKGRYNYIDILLIQFFNSGPTVTYFQPVDKMLVMILLSPT